MRRKIAPLLMLLLIAVAVLSDQVFVTARIPMEKSVDTLEDHAREIIASLGFTEKPADTARGIIGLGEPPAVPICAASMTQRCRSRCSKPSESAIGLRFSVSSGAC